MTKHDRRASRAIQKEIKRNSKLTPAQIAAKNALEAQENKVEHRTSYRSPNAGWGRLF